MLAHLFSLKYLSLVVLALTTTGFAQEPASQPPAQDQPKAKPTPPQPTPSQPPVPSMGRQNLGHVQLISVTVENGKLKLRVKKATNEELDLIRPYSDQEASQLIVGRYICNAQSTVVNSETHLVSPYVVVQFLAACETTKMKPAAPVLLDSSPQNYCVPCPAAPCVSRRWMILRCRR
ncbi:MAG: hypothetical protein N2039_08230 [Gemmataceae bacterium]|nr:hypothetical protein [Gemmataceae bacterium]